MMAITLVGQSAGYSLFLTNAAQSITFAPAEWGSTVTFEPFPFSRSALQEEVAASVDSAPDLTITASNVSSAMSGLLNSAIGELAKVSIWLTDRSLIDSLATRPRNACRISIGEIRDLSLTETTLSFRIASIMAQAGRVTVPRRTFIGECNYGFGDGSCGVNRHGNDANNVPIQVSTTAQAGTTANYIVVQSSVLTSFDDPADPIGFFSGADVLMTSGAAGLQSQPIQRVQQVGSQWRVYLRNALLTTPAVGDALTIRRWCRKTLSDCKLYHSDGSGIMKYGGFPDMPPVLFRPTSLPHPGLLSI